MPTGEDGAPEGFEIIGISPATLGEVFSSGTTEWAGALAAGDPFIERITRNVLARSEGAE